MQFRVLTHPRMPQEWIDRYSIMFASVHTLPLCHSGQARALREAERKGASKNPENAECSIAASGNSQAGLVIVSSDHGDHPGSPHSLTFFVSSGVFLGVLCGWLLIFLWLFSVTPRS